MIFVSVSMNGWRKRKGREMSRQQKIKSIKWVTEFFHHRVYFIFDFRYDHSHSMMSVLFLLKKRATWKKESSSKLFARVTCERKTKKVLKYHIKKFLSLYTSTHNNFCEKLYAPDEIRVVRKIFCYLAAKIFYEITKSFRRCQVNIKSGCKLFSEQIRHVKKFPLNL